jgi:hypothetical protein
MGRHVVVTEEAGRRVRLQGVFTDEEFFALPLVKQYGCFPAGYAACHFGDEDGVGSEHYLAIPESSRRAVDVLRELLKGAKAARYALVVNGNRVSYHASQRDALQALSRQIGSWRAGGSHRGQQTALNLSGTGWAPADAVQRVAYKLKTRSGGRTGTVGTAYAIPTATDAINFAKAIKQEVESCLSSP